MSVYLLYAEGTDFVKIGYTKHDTVSERLLTLQTATPTKLIVMGFMRGASRGIEATFKQEYRARKERGEWFKLSKEERDALAERFTGSVFDGEEREYPTERRAKEGDYGIVVIAGCGLGEYDNEDTFPCERHRVAHLEEDEVCADCQTVALVVIADGFVEVPFANIREATREEERFLPWARMSAVKARVPQLIELVW